jgi:hypothetical protein
VRGAECVGERMPFVHRQHDAEMAHRHVVAVDRFTALLPVSSGARCATSW